MSNRIKTRLVAKYGFFRIFAVCVFAILAVPAVADEYADQMDAIGAASVAEYEIDGSLFQRIAGLEQEKVLTQLEKERIQLELDLDRLAAEKIKLQMEVDVMTGRAQEQSQKLIEERNRLDREREQLEQQKRNMTENSGVQMQATIAEIQRPADEVIASKYKLVEIVGAGNQLQATLEDLDNGQKKKVWVGRNIDGFDVRSISLDDGVVFVKDGNAQLLNIGVSR